MTPPIIEALMGTPTIAQRQRSEDRARWQHRVTQSQAIAGQVFVWTLVFVVIAAAIIGVILLVEILLQR